MKRSIHGYSNWSFHLRVSVDVARIAILPTSGLSGKNHQFIESNRKKSDTLDAFPLNPRQCNHDPDRNPRISRRRRLLFAFDF